MPESDTPPALPPPNNQETDKGFTHLVRLLWDSFLDFFSIQKFGNHLRGEVGVAVKKAPILFAVFICLIALIFLRGCDKDSQIKDLRQTNANYVSNNAVLFTTIASANSTIGTYQGQVQTLNTKVEEKSSTIAQVVQERDNLRRQLESSSSELAIIKAWSTNIHAPILDYESEIKVKAYYSLDGKGRSAFLDSHYAYCVASYAPLVKDVNATNITAWRGNYPYYLGATLALNPTEAGYSEFHFRLDEMAQDMEREAARGYGKYIDSNNPRGRIEAAVAVISASLIPRLPPSERQFLEGICDRLNRITATTNSP